jgi:hypothetical protein
MMVGKHSVADWYCLSEPRHYVPSVKCTHVVAGAAVLDRNHGAQQRVAGVVEVAELGARYEQSVEVGQPRHSSRPSEMVPTLSSYVLSFLWIIPSDCICHNDISKHFLGHAVQVGSPHSRICINGCEGTYERRFSFQVLDPVVIVHLHRLRLGVHDGA